VISDKATRGRVPSHRSQARRDDQPSDQIARPNLGHPPIIRRGRQRVESIINLTKGTLD
jgi:hypothetical protein